MIPNWWRSGRDELFHWTLKQRPITAACGVRPDLPMVLHDGETGPFCTTCLQHMASVRLAGEEAIAAAREQLLSKKI